MNKNNMLRGVILLALTFCVSARFLFGQTKEYKKGEKDQAELIEKYGGEDVIKQNKEKRDKMLQEMQSLLNDRAIYYKMAEESMEMTEEEAQKKTE